MTTVKHLFGKALTVTMLVALATAVDAATVGTGPTVEFSKADFADQTLAENQDRITPLVWLTRGVNQGLFNIAQEDAYQQFQGISPAGTLWAFEGLNGNTASGEDFNAENFGALIFDEWASALGGGGGLRFNIVNTPGVVHLVDDDIYLDIVFTEWTPQSGGGFAYERSSVIPIPAAAWLMASALGLLGFVKRRLAN